ncbi:MAG: 1-(5-phosphoribosyl)-5-[(5-phosphoribosylamino)methylideneamino]imidazole-4-carboxamide isomerase [Spirochaetes bacterium GWF1_51_8]|nr:MAG: 1-(5-phosphoribosyl)-5-[(5-phosphoribosylamino)methylideneamino]imidazole-4-carboxamide isomerase [Spirochaetes bacterium GWF1_51_8]
MLIIPAVDIKDRKCVRLVRGDPQFETVYSTEPVFQAKYWEREGAKRLHIVDLDGAFEGKTKNLDIIQRIVEEVNIVVQVGGGIRDNRIIRALKNRGVHKIVIGTAAVENRKFIKNLCKTEPESIIIAIDAHDGFVVKKGWKEVTDKRAVDLVKELEEYGVQEVIYTDINRDGTLEGPNYDSIETMLTVTEIPIIVSGGVSSLDDLKRLTQYENDGLRGVIIGKALYEGRFKLSEALKFDKS